MGTPTRVGIIGAGDTGAALAAELLAKSRHDFRVVLFFDDDSTKWDSGCMGFRSWARWRFYWNDPNRLHLHQVIIAMPSAQGKRIQEVVQFSGASSAI